ncbi:GSH-dependent disulfide-bond oxidoreductase, partial [Tremellales sp. Uapishka_1]
MSSISAAGVQHPPSLSSATSPAKLHLYTVNTPNGVKVSVLLEELVAAYGPEVVNYDYFPISFKDQEQKSPEFLKINPNGRIPALVDDNHGGHNVFETASILIWLVENYDKENKFWFSDPLERSKAISWIMFGQGGVGPMQGQANHFFRYAPEKIPYGIKRYQEETQRLYTVIEDGLNAGKGEYLVGDKFSIVDISLFGWVRAHEWAGIDIAPTPKVKAWLERIAARPAVAAGTQIPPKEAPKTGLSKEEEEKQTKEAAAWIFQSAKK